MKKFKKGDRVMVTDRYYLGTPSASRKAATGKHGEVEDIEGGYCQVFLDGNRTGLWLHSEELVMESKRD